MSFESDKVRLMKQSISLEQLNMDTYLLYQKTSPRKQTIIFGLLEILGALKMLKKILMMNIARTQFMYIDWGVILFKGGKIE